MKILLSILIILVFLLPIVGVIYMFVLEDIQTKEHIKWLAKLDELENE